ncbi:MAG: hypothetical protein R3E88_03930 [Myxococcota bacterium]
MPASRRAFRDLIELLRAIDDGYIGDVGETKSALDVADGHRLLLHGLRRALGAQLEGDVHRPAFQRAVTPTMKFGGDSPDAIYHECNVSDAVAYRVRGHMAGAVYVSLSVQAGGGEGEGVGSSIHSDQFAVGPDGSFEVELSRAAPADGCDWVRMPDGALNVIVRHYFEDADGPMAVARRPLALEIRALDPPPASGEPTAEDVAAGIDRVTRWLRSRTLDEAKGRGRLPAWVSVVPNQFNDAEKPGADLAYAALDIAYAMAPFHVPPGKALVVHGRFPACRYAGLVLWSRFRQSLDYRARRVALNRAQTVTDDAGHYRIVIADRDPGVPNWLDTGGRQSGMMYWRFLLPEEPVPTPRCELVDLD